MKAIEEREAKPMVSCEETPAAVGMPEEAIELDSGRNEIMEPEFLCGSVEDLRGGLSCATIFEGLPSGIAEKNQGNNGDGAVMKIKMANPSVHVEDYDGSIHVLKSLCGNGDRFTINLRFDVDSPNLHKFIDYFTELSEEVGTVNMPFSKSKYKANLDVEFSKAAIVKEE